MEEISTCEVSPLCILNHQKLTSGEGRLKPASQTLPLWTSSSWAPLPYCASSFFLWLVGDALKPETNATSVHSLLWAASMYSCGTSVNKLWGVFHLSTCLLLQRSAQLSPMKGREKLIPASNTQWFREAEELCKERLHFPSGAAWAKLIRTLDEPQTHRKAHALSLQVRVGASAFLDTS